MLKQIQTMVMIALTALVGVSTWASSQLGYGNTSCAIYNAVQKDGGELVANIDSWTLGYLSGLNHAAQANGQSDKLRRQQPARIAAYVRSYCASKVNDTIVQAVDSFWVSSTEES